MRCRLLLLLVLLLVYANLNAQQKTGIAKPLFTDPSGSGPGADPGPGLAALRTDFLSLSPEAEALGKYGSLPVTLFTGQPEISIPIYDLKMPTLDLNFSLSYNYNGYKPNEIASCVGLGWSVQGGGVITRIVKGQIDEGMSAGNRYDDFINPNMLSWSQAFLTKIGTASQDAEPDIYSFNVGGYSGRFILIKGKAYLFPYQNLRITPVGQGFDLVDDKGNDYQFNVFETTFSKIATQIPTTNFPSAWYVTQITTADKKHTVNFSYIPYTYFQPSVVTDSYTIDSRALGTSGQTMSTIITQGDHINALLLSSVFSDYGAITFTHSTNRTDLNGSVGGQSLDLIDVVSTIPGSGFDKELRLNHAPGSAKLSLQSVSVNELSPVVTSYQYSFSYLTGSQPDQTTYGIDAFGYANGANNQMLFPAGEFSPALYNYADRGAHMVGSQVGMISQITYPTGGYTQFNWEPNQIGHYFATYTQTPVLLGDQVSYNAALAKGGITTDTKNFSISAAQTVTLITSLPSDNLPVPTSPVLLIYDANNTVVYTSPLLTWPQLASDETLFLGPGTYKMVTQCSSNVVSVLATVNYQANVATNINNTLADGPGLRIGNITDYDGVNAAPTSVRNYTYNEGTSFLSNTAVLGGQQYNSCASFFMENFQSSVRGALSELASQEFYYKDVTVTTQDPTRSGQTTYTFTAPSAYACDVKPVSETEYKYANYNWLPVKSANYSYQTTIKYQFNGYKSKVTTVLGPQPAGVFGCTVLASPDPTQAMDLLQIYSLSEPYQLVGDFTTLSSKAETVYSDLDGTPQSSSTAYYYDDPDHGLPTREVTSNSIGETLTTYNSYPLDYHFQGCTGTLSAIQNNFNQDVANCGNVASADLAALTTALAPYQPFHGNTAANQATFTNIVNSFNPVGDYTGAIATAVSNRNTAWTNYFSCLATGIAASTTAWQQGVLSLEQNNIITPVIEKSTALTKLDNSQWLMGATRNEYNLFLNPSSVKLAEPARIQQAETDGSLPYSSFTAATDNYYKPQVYFGYDGRLNLNEQNKVNNIPQSYLWNYLDVYPVAQVIGAAPADIAYTSFEADNKGNWNFSTAAVAVDASCPTGASAYTLSATNTLTTTNALDPTKTYIVSYWSKTGSAYSIPGTASGYPVAMRSHNGWTCYEHKVTGQGQISIGGSGGIDEVRLFPDKSLMTTWWYQPLAGMAGTCDPDHHISYYEYDGLGRLTDVKDQDGNIVKTFDYHYRNSGN
jgi:YD repeat-containing protein